MPSVVCMPPNINLTKFACFVCYVHLMFVRAVSIKSLCGHSGGAFEQAANCKLFEQGANCKLFENLNMQQSSFSFVRGEDGDRAQYFVRFV